MSDLDAVVAVYGTHSEAEEAVKKLQRGGIDMHTLSIVGKIPTPMYARSDTTITATG
jgi:hypothetical protein